MKRIICAAMCASLTLGSLSIPAFASDNVISDRLLIGMGVIDEKFDREKNLTRAEFVDLIMRTADMAHFSDGKLMYEDVAAGSDYFDSICAAYNMGLLSDAKYFRPDDEITAGEAAVILTTLLGYKPYIEANAFMQKAVSCGVFDGVSKTPDGKITGADALLLVTNTLEAKALVQSTNNDAELTDVSYMSEYLDMYKDEGIVTGDGIADFDETSPAEGKVKIDGEEYDYDGTLDGMLGKCIEFYYKELSDGTRELIAYEEKSRNTVRTFNANSITSDTTTTSFAVKDENGKKRTYQIPLDVKVIYNGTSKFGFTAEDLRPKVGNVTLISNDGDSTTDVIIINDYVLAAAASVSAGSQTISMKYSDSRISTNKIDLKDYDRYSITKDGAKIAISDIKEWDVLHIAENADKTVITIAVTDGAVSGEIKAIEADGDDTYWNIDGEKYAVSTGYCDADTVVKVGAKGVFYLDIEGRIAFCDTSTTQKSNYMILLKVGYDSENERAFLRVFNRSNTAVTVFCADKVKIKGYIPSEAMVVENTYKEAADIPEVISNTYANTLFNPVLIEADDDGNVKKITFAWDVSSKAGYKGYDDGNFTLDKYAQSQSFMYSWANGCYFPTTTPIFIIPRPADGISAEKRTSIMQDPENYSATTFGAEIGIDTTEESRDYAKLYDIDKFNTPSIMTIEKEYTEVDDPSNSETTAYNEFMLVTKNTVMLDDDDDARRKICGYYKGNYAEYWVKDENVANVSGVDVGSTGSKHACLPNSDERMFGFTSNTKKFTIWGNTGKSVSKIKVGDVIQPNFNMKGELDSFRTLYSRELEGTEVRYNAAGTAIGKGDDDDLVYVLPGEYYELSENPNLDTDAGRAVLYTAYGEVVALSGTSFRYKTRYRQLNSGKLETFDVERVRIASNNVYIIEDGEVKVGSADDITVGDKVFVHVRDYTCKYVYIIRD